jgi:hypothetical protein
MQALKTVAREALGLFVEDARLTAALVVWIALIAALSRWAGLNRWFGASALFAGCLLILIENLVHAARRDK